MRAALAAWQLDDAAKGLKKAKRSPERAVLMARLELQQSKFEAVDKRLTPHVAAHPDDFEARVVLGRALYAMGQKTRAYTVLDAMADAYNDDRVQTAADLMWLGIGLHLTNYPKNANQVFQEALDVDGGLQDVRLRWAELFLEKYNYQDADLLYEEVLQKAADHPAAVLGRAVIDLDSDRDYPKAREKAEKLVADAPSFVPAHTLLARIELENERPEEAIRILEQESLAIAPRDLRALALLGAATFVADDAAAFRKAEKRALKVNPRFAAFYTTVSQHASRVHRYAEAAELDRKALKLDPEHWRAYASLGIGMSRLGDDLQAQSYLEKAYDGDPYDVRTFNMLDSFYDRTIRQYEWIETPPMRVRVHRDEKPVLERYVPDLLQESWKHLTGKYGFVPEAPVHIEIFPDPELFAVRSIGLPQLQAHGICFGHVITARSPSSGDFNWAEVLWHELSHVFHIQLSKSRVPRWFTEGLAVYEATEGRPEWKREMDATMLAYRRADRLRGVADFNLSFTRARSLQDILVAYYHAYRMAQFIDQEFGIKKMKKMLVLWGEKKTTAQVFAKALGVKDLADFDRRFLAWLDAELAHLAGSFALELDLDATDADKRMAAADAAKGDAVAQAQAAEAALSKRDVDKALAYAEAALALDADQPTALLLRGKVKLGRDDPAGATADLERLLKAGFDGVEVRGTLARAAKAAGDAEAAIRHLEAAVGIDPQAGELIHAVIGLLDDAGRDAEAYAWRKKAVAVDQMSVALVDALLAGAVTHGATKAEILRWGELGNHVAPFSVEHHLLFARQLKRIGEAEKARYEAASALAIDPNNEEAKALGQ